MPTVIDDITQADNIEGCIAVIQADMARWADFDKWLVEMRHKQNAIFIWARGLNIAEARNNAIDLMLRSEAQWMWFLDDDMDSHNKDLLQDLLNRNVDIVQPLSLNRKTLQYNAFVDYDGSGFTAWDGSCDDATLQKGLLNVVACGAGGTLIRRRVFEAFEKPVFRVGVFKPDVISEDLFFTHSAYKKGFTVCVDLHNRMNHFTGCSLETEIIDGKICKQVKLPFHKLMAAGL